MANKKTRRKKTKKKEQPPVPLSEPWINRRSGFTVMGVLSLALAVFMTWQLYPTEGFGRAVLWGLAFAVAIWVIFGVSLIFNTWVRGRRQGDSS